MDGSPRAGGAPPRLAPAAELELLRATVENGLDAMVVVSPDGDILSVNQRFQEVWPIDASVIASGSDEAALESVLDKVVDPDAFLTRVQEMYARRSGTSRDTLLLRDGRTLDRHGTALTADDGRYLGWAWSFRDVTQERAAAQDAERMASLVAVAQALAATRTEEDVLEVVSSLGTSALGARGAGLCLPEPGGATVRVLMTAFLDAELRSDLAVLPIGTPLPIVDAAVTGTTYFLPDRAAAEALFPGALSLYVQAGTEGSAEVPLRAQDRLLGCLSVAFREPRAWREGDRALVQALAALTAQALERVRLLQAELDAVDATRRLSESLQRSLLTSPPPDDDLVLAVRYQPAALEAQVGGDWYDVFRSPDGSTTLVIGDVAGHDRDAAAAMAQLRNVLRGVAQLLEEPPDAVLSALDRVLHSLEASDLASAVLCQVRHGAAGVAWSVRWSNAGHPPPLLVPPDGQARLLSTEPDLLLGLVADTPRATHSVDLAPGSTLVLYTDGLVERRGESLEVGLERLRAVAQDAHGCAPEELCDLLLARLASGREDDVALLVLHLPA